MTQLIVSATLTDRPAKLVRSKDRELNIADNGRIGQIIRSIQIGMLTTLQEDGQLRSLPMLCADFDFDALWFLVKESKPLLAESIAHGVVNVAFACPEKKIYASVR